MTKQIPTTVYLLLALSDKGQPYVVQHRTFWKTPEDAEKWWNRTETYGIPHDPSPRVHWAVPVVLPVGAAAIEWKRGKTSQADFFVGA